MLSLFISIIMVSLLSGAAAYAQPERVVDIPTRSGISQRFLFSASTGAKAAVILFAGGHGGMQILPSGKFSWGRRNFLVRNRSLFAEQGLAVATIDAPSDRQSSPYLGGFRQTPEHVADVKAVIAWIKHQSNLPVWLVGTSRGTQSAGYIAVESAGIQGGPDGVVLTSTILTDEKSRPVPDLDLARVAVPVLVVHHREDGCRLCAYRDLPKLMNKLTAAARKELITIDGGINIGDPCEAQAYHGFNGRDEEVVKLIRQWITQ